MYGGDGTIEFYHILKTEEMNGLARVYAQDAIPVGASIGYYVYHSDGESVYVLKGKGVMDNNHEKEIELYPGVDTFTLDGKGHEVKNTFDEPLIIMTLIVYSKQKEC